MSNSILVVDDDPFLRQQIGDLMRLNGYDVTVASNGEQGLLSLKNQEPRLVILDLGLPDLDGTTVARIVRTQSQVPILMLTARSTAADKVLGLELGADDYLTKPFDPSELVARVRALLRRTENLEPKEKVAAANIGNVVLDEVARRVLVNNVPLNLTNREYDLLNYLVANRDRALSREQIFEHVWGYDIEFSSNTLDVIVYRLRNKITEAGGPDVIQTMRGYGYMLSLKES